MGKLIVLVWGMRNELEFFRTKALVIAQKHSENPKALDEVFKDVWKATFPFQERTQEKLDVKAKEKLIREVNRGPLTVSPIALPKKPPKPKQEVNIGPVSNIDAKPKRKK